MIVALATFFLRVLIKITMVGRNRQEFQKANKQTQPKPIKHNQIEKDHTGWLIQPNN